MILYEETSGFKKDCKRLGKKYLSLSDDLKELREILSDCPFGAEGHFHVLRRTEKATIVKCRLFCDYLNKQSLRVVYAYLEAADRIVFLELYFKGDQAREDRRRIDACLRALR